MIKFIKEQFALVLVISAFLVFIGSVIADASYKIPAIYFAAVLIFLGVRGIRGMIKKKN